jgi:hypothetical protein
MLNQASKYGWRKGDLKLISSPQPNDTPELKSAKVSRNSLEEALLQTPIEWIE